MRHLMSFPTKKEVIDSWAKMLDDFTKVSVMAMPVIFFGKDTIPFKAFAIFGLLIVAACALIGAKVLRENIDNLTTEAI